MNKLLLHVCCGPCSLEPYRLLSEANWDITLHYSNDNIFPASEFERRKDTLMNWAKQNGIDVVYDTYDNEKWQRLVGGLAEAKPGTPKRIARCGQCYKERLEKSAEYAVQNGFSYMTTSLAVSPYQYTNEIKFQLENVCRKYALKPIFKDFRPYYRKATKHSLEIGMYRQKYCGCEFSLRESNAQMKARAAQKEERAKRNAANALEVESRKKERQAYQRKQERKRDLLKEYKSQH